MPNIGLTNKQPPCEDTIMAQAMDEITRANTQALGVPMPHPEHGDKCLLALCEAMSRDPAEKSQLREWVAQISNRPGARHPATSSTKHYQKHS